MKIIMDIFKNKKRRLITVLLIELVIIMLGYCQKAVSSSIIDNLGNLKIAILFMTALFLSKVCYVVLDTIANKLFGSTVLSGLNSLICRLLDKPAKTSDTLNVINKNISDVDDFLNDTVLATISVITDILSLSIFIIKIDIVVYLYTLAGVIFMILFISKYNTVIVSLNKALNKSSIDLNNYVLKLSKMHSYIRYHGIYMRPETNTIVGKYSKAQLDSYNSLANMGCIRLIVQGLFTLVWGITTLIVLKNKATSGQFATLFLSTISSVINVSRSISYLITKFKKIGPSIDSIESILNTPNEESGSIKIESIESIKLDNVTFGYDDKPVISNVSLDITRNESQAFVGPSGSGKSTMLGIIQGVNRCPGVYVNGIDIRDIDIVNYRQKIAIVSQTVNLFSGTLLENLVFGLSDYKIEDVNSAIEKAELSSYVDGLENGLNTYVDEDIMSGGQKQRIAIARAILRDPDVIILDEATSALDSITEKKVKVALDNLMSGRICVGVAHRLSTIADYSNISVISNGHIAEEGTLDSLLESKGEFYKLWNSQLS